MKYDVIIIGAGPGGIFSAYELMKKSPGLKVAVFEAGYSLEKRRCPIDGKKVKSCIKCPTCAIMSGFGGAGAFSDGKYNITNDFGGTLYEHIGRKEAIDLMYYVDEINVNHGGESTRMFSTAGTKFKKLCMQNKLKPPFVFLQIFHRIHRLSECDSAVIWRHKLMFQHLKSLIFKSMICQLQKQPVLKNTAAQCHFIASTLLPDLYACINDLISKFPMKKICQSARIFTI